MEERELPKIDLIFELGIWLRYARRFWALAVAMALLGAGFLGWYSQRVYIPQYEASVSFTVRGANPLYGSDPAYNSVTAKQLNSIFPFILRSAILRQRVSEQLGVSTIPNVTTTVLGNSNIITLRVRHSDPDWAYEVLQTVVECCPQVADYVVGATNLVILDDSGVPGKPLHALGWRESLVLGGVGGIGIWAVVVLVLAWNRRTIHGDQELRRMLDDPCLGMIPEAKAASWQRGIPLIHAAKGQLGFAEAIRLLQLRVRREMQRRGHQILMVSGAIPGEGKTTVAVNLAVSLAQQGRRVLLVDCDRYAPMALRALDAAQEPARMIRTEVRNLYGMRAQLDGPEAGGKEKLRQFLESVRGDFDDVILDTPPCTLTVDAAELSDLAECALLVIRQDHASRFQIMEGVELLTDSGMPVLGWVLNGVTGSLASYGYGYGSRRN